VTVTAPLEIPELVRQRAMAQGDLGCRWLDELPLVVATLADRWELQIGHPFQGGTAAFVTSATEGSGRACALKVAMPPEIDPVESFRRSVLVHQLAAGRGCAELIRLDESIPAMLLERLGPNLDDLGMSVSQILETVTATLRSFWQPLDEDCDLPSGPEKAGWLADYITTTWSELGRPCERTVIERAVRYCDDRAAAYDPSRAVLVHGDAHGWNTLDAGGGTFKFVDPEGLRSERAHDLSVPMREYNQPLLIGDTARLVRERAELLASWCEIDPEPVWQWGFIERVSTGLANVRDFEGDEGLDFLEVAARCL
jgi:streptomycin 6-kinase